jgi:serine/threonine-protein kinase RsbW
MSRSVAIRIRNEISELATLRAALDSLGNEMGVPAPALMQLQVALDEIASNVIKYSRPDGSDPGLLVRITAQAEKVTLKIIDDGVPFDPRDAPEPDRATANRRPHPGGRGIHMIRQLVDRIAYRRINGRNHTTLTKNCGVGTFSKSGASDEQQ